MEWRELEHRDPRALLALGRLYETNDRLDEAIEIYEKLLGLDFEFKDKLREGIKKVKEKRDAERQANAP